MNGKIPKLVKDFGIFINFFFKNACIQLDILKLFYYNSIVISCCYGSVGRARPW